MQFNLIGTIAVVCVFCQGLAQAAPAKVAVVPTPAKTLEERAANRKLAEVVVRALSACEAAADADLEILVVGGSVTLSGSVANEERRRAIMEVVRGVERVDTVKDLLDAKSVIGLNATSPASASNAVAAAKFKPRASAPVEKVSDRKSFDKVVGLPIESDTTAVSRLNTSTAQPPIQPRFFPTDTSNGNMPGRKLHSAVVAESQPSETGNADTGIAVIGKSSFERQKRDPDIVPPVEGANIANIGRFEKAVGQAPTEQFVASTTAVDPLAAQFPSPSPNPQTGQPQVDPMPIGSNAAHNGLPQQPPNVWRPYAPNLNFTPVADPKAIPSGRFPFVGPYYPDPKVPLGWRKVTLEWQDGHWWLGRKQAPIDYWRSKFGY